MDHILVTLAGPGASSAEVQLNQGPPSRLVLWLLMAGM